MAIRARRPEKSSQIATPNGQANDDGPTETAEADDAVAVAAAQSGSFFSSFGPPQPHAMDARSLASLRILLSLLVLYEVYTRLFVGDLETNLAWYVSQPRDRSVLGTDTPLDPNPIHRIWFHRGGAAFQLVWFALTAVAAASFGMGNWTGLSTWTLWFLVTAVQERCAPLQNHCDKMLRCVLLWCGFLPMGRIWSLDEYLQRGRKGRGGGRAGNAKGDDSFPLDTCIVSGPGCLGLALQIFYMYLGAVCHRTIDMYGCNLKSLSRSKWLPPQLSAVHYILSSNYTRQWAIHLIGRHPTLSMAMTASAMVLEVAAPLLCLLAPCSSSGSGKESGSSRFVWRHLPAAALFSLHIGMYVCMNLPHWQYLGMALAVVWVPTPVWDDVQERAAKWFPGVFGLPVKPDGLSKKIDDENGDGSSAKKNQPTARGSAKDMWRIGGVSKILASWLLVYMTCDFVAERGWTGMPDGRAVANVLRMKQSWKMMVGGPKTYFNVMTTARLEKQADVVGDSEGRRIDLWLALRSRQWGPASEINETTYMEMREMIKKDALPSPFPEQRWETAFLPNEHGSSFHVRRGMYQRIASVLCKLGNERRSKEGFGRITHVELIWQHLHIMPMGNATRFKEGKTFAKEVNCAFPPLHFFDSLQGGGFRLG